VRDAAFTKRAHQLLREIDRERQIVPSVDKQRPPIAETLEVPSGTDWLPERAQQVELDMAVQSFTHVTCRQPAPDDVGEVWRNVVERLGPNERLVRGRQERKA
jgi:hypothetical protein